MQDNTLGALNVLIADDERLIQRLVYDVLIKLGFRHITVASSGRQAMDIVARQEFDFIITDWRMKDLDGIDLIRFVRSSTMVKNTHIPIILLTGNTEISDVVEARDAGVNEYVIKPFSAAQLVKRIRSIIERPMRFIEAPTYRGPDRRRRVGAPPNGVERRKRRSIL